MVLPAMVLPAMGQKSKAAVVAEAPSTVDAVYVSPSIEVPLNPGEKINQLYTRNYTQDYTLQKLTKRTYWVQRQYYATLFYVGDKGVLLFDPIEGRTSFILKAIKAVTPLPVTAIVYSHAHADHIADAQAILDASAQSDIKKVRIIASKATANKLKSTSSTLPKPTEVLAWPSGSFMFEKLKVKLYGFERAAHTDDHAGWLLISEKILHCPDLLNPDQVPFWAFGGSERFTYLESNLKQMQSLDWTFANGGHGNIGSKDDFVFYHQFIADLKAAVSKAMQQNVWGQGLDPAKTNTHAVYLTSWLAAVSKQATEELRPKYGKYYGFEASTPRNAEMIASSLYSYK